MILLLSTELCVLGVFAAAAVVALCVRPARRGPVREHLLAGRLTSAAIAPGRPWLEIEVGADNTVTLTRRGLGEVYADTGAVSLAVTVSSFDIDLREHRVAGYGYDNIATEAAFTLDFLAPERYRVTYRRDNDEVSTAFTLQVKPGVHRIFY